jgi:hypothetical protein
METIYNAEHTFRFRLDKPFKYDNREIDTIRIELMWVDAEDGEPEGWWVTSEFYGWPLTTKGTRDKRVKDRERVYHLLSLPFPAELRPLVDQAWALAVDRTKIDGSHVVNYGNGLFSPQVWESPKVTA